MNNAEKSSFLGRLTVNRNRFIKDVFLGVFLVFVGAGIGIGNDYFREKPLGWRYQGKAERMQASVQRLKTGGEGSGGVVRQAPEGEVMIGDIEGWLADKTPGVLLLDVRPDVFFHKIGHIPGAKSFPGMEMEKLYPEYKTAISAAVRVVVYCDGMHCQEAEHVAKALKELGHENISIYRGGWQEWSKRVRLL